MLFIDLIEESGILMVVDLVANTLASSLDIDVADQSLLVVETRDSKDRRRRLNESLGLQLNHGITSAWFRSSNENRSYGRFDLLLFLLALIIIFFSGGLFLLHFLFFLAFLTLSAGRLDNDWLLFLGDWLQVSKFIGISIKVEQLRDSIWLG